MGTMTQQTLSHVATTKVVKTQVEYNTILVENKDIPQDEKDKLLRNIKAMRIIKFALPPYSFHLVSACEKKKEISNRLKDLYSSDEDL